MPDRAACRRTRPKARWPPAIVLAWNCRPRLWCDGRRRPEPVDRHRGRRFADLRRPAVPQIRPDDRNPRAISPPLLPLASGRVLLGTEKNGVLVWDGRTLGRYHPALADLEVTALAGSEAGSLDRNHRPRSLPLARRPIGSFLGGPRASGSASPVARGVKVTPPTPARR